MFKIIILISLFAVVEPNLETFCGEWKFVMKYPDDDEINMCLRYDVRRDSRNISCTCDGGRNTTMIEVQLLDNLITQAQENATSRPFIEVTNIEDIKPALEISCICGNETFRDNFVGRSLNKEYIVIYEYLTYNQSNASNETNEAYVYARNFDTAQVIQATVQRDEELKHRQGAIICSEESVLEIMQNLSDNS